MGTSKLQSSMEEVLTEAETRAASDRFQYGKYGPFVEVRKELEEAGRMEDAKLMQWAAEAFMFHERRERDSSEAYFGPMVVFEGGQEGPEWTNMEGAKIDFYAQRAATAVSPIIVTRYADIVWEKRREHTCARLAGESYVEAAKLYRERDFYHEMQAALIRSLELALLLRDAQLVRQRIQIIMDDFLAQAEAERRYDCVLQLLQSVVHVPRRHLNLSLQRGLEAYALRAAAEIREQDTEADLFTERAFLEIARDIRSRVGGKSGADDMLRMIARSFERNGELSEGRSHMVASHFYNDALACYQQLGDREKVTELLLKIRDSNAKAQGEFGVISSEVRLTAEQFDAVIAPYLEGGSTGENLGRLAHGFWPRLDVLREQLHRLKEEAPLQFMIPWRTFTGDNRAVGEALDEQAIFEQHVVRYLRMEYQMNAHIIAEILARLTGAHGLDAESLADFICRSEIIGSDRRNFLIRAFERYFDGDYASCIHLLVPQIEHFLRRVLPRLGVSETYVDDQGLMWLLPLDQVLRTEHIRNSFGDDLWRYFYTFLVDRDGENVRNDIAHGIVEWDRCNLTVATILVHLLLILTVFSFHPEESASQTR